MTVQRWPEVRIRFVGRLNPSKSEVGTLSKDTEVTFLPMDAIGDNGSIRLDATRSLAAVDQGYTYFRNGDVAIAKITPCFENGKGALMSGLLGGIGFGTTELIVVRPDHCRITGPFLQWLFTSSHFRNAAEASMYGAGGQKRVPDDFVRDFEVLLPTLTEQSAIAAFLDRETGKIDALVAEQERLIALLKEKLQAVISHAVTKGLNPGVVIKNPEVEWLGKLPAHWRSVRFKDVCTDIVDCKNRTPEQVLDGNYYVIRTTCIRNMRFDIEGAYKTDKSNFDAWTSKGLPRLGDVLFTREAPAGEACLAPSDIQFCLGQRMMYLRPNANLITSEFVLNSVYSPLVRSFIEGKSRGSTVSHLRVGEIGELPILLPPLREQHEICKRLRLIESEHQRLISQSSLAVTLLRERRAALISAAVTGKIDVRDAVPATRDAA